MVRDLFDRLRRDDDREPRWVSRLEERLDTQDQKINTLIRMMRADMQFDTQVVAKLVAAAGAVAEQSKAVAAERDAYKALAEENGASRDAVQAKLDEALAAEAEEDRVEAAATADINAAADALLGLVKGAETPDVAPVPVEEVPAVVDGSQPVTDSAGEEIAADENPPSSEGVVAGDGSADVLPPVDGTTDPAPAVEPVNTEQTDENRA